MTPAPSTRSSLVVLWLDGQACGVADREGWALTAGEAEEICAAGRTDGLGVCVVSTCFRAELAVSGDAPTEDLLAWGRRQLALARPSLDAAAFRSATGEDAVRHMVRGASGLESAVLGEAQILGQVRRARATAEQARTLSPELRVVLDGAIQAGQRVRAETTIARGAASTASAAVRWASDALDGLEGRHVGVAGGGQSGRLLLEHLARIDTASTTLVSARAHAHAGFTVVRPPDLPDLLPRTDALFAGTDRIVLDGGLAREAWDDGRQRAVVDLGVPRNVAPEAGRVPDVALADVDALGAVVDAGLAARRAAIPEAEAIVESAVEELDATLATLERERLVADFRRRAESVRQQTLAYVCDKCSDRTCGAETEESGPGPGPCSDPDVLSKTLTKRLLHDVTVALRSGQGDDDVLRRLLALDGDG